MSPFERLGLALDADEREIKLAYARELKRVRPDEDPQGFQALHDAYSQCLAWARRTPDPADDDADDEGALSFRLDEDEFRRMLDRVVQTESAHETTRATIEVTAPATPLPIDPDLAEPMSPAPWQYRRTSPAPGPDAWPQLDTPAANEARAIAWQDRFESGELLEELIGIARRRPVQEIERWLHAHPDLYSVEHKQAVANALVEHLLDEPPLPLAALETLLRFFDLDAIHPGFPRRHEDVAVLRNQSLHHGVVVAELRGEHRSPAAHRRYRSREVRWFWFWIAAMFAIAIVRVFSAMRSP
ncbi:J domain-containing protein [Lysobacter capsici]|uniref:J domain-containing protein n=1 Tax=Lysobacter capsici TaxID=435897 RepID=UPI001BFFDC53|nr:J domain-containing protein [Lysobacter capsici]QWF15135.1 J domain-containing protein [Lysobacter capsici]